jgi:dihydrofolate reductase
VRKIVLNLAVSLDGYIAGPNGEYDWCLTDADYGLTEFIESIDTTLMGRKTFDLIQQYGPPYPTLTNYVFSKTIQTSSFNNVIITNEEILSVARRLKATRGKNIWLYGGAEIISPLIENNEVDEMILSVHPLLLGDGIPLFKKQSTRHHFKLIDVIKYPSGLVQLIHGK